METLKVSGEAPLARFGHTITLVSKTKAVLFGGATGDTGKYTITGDTYLFDCITRKWKKLEPSGSAPIARAAHSSTTVETNQLVIYGGATGGITDSVVFLFFFRWSTGIR
jgi:N-acetylneuraminic acid mutarotase